MSNTVLDYLMSLISGLLLPSFIFITSQMASRQAEEFDNTTENYRESIGRGYHKRAAELQSLSTIHK